MPEDITSRLDTLRGRQLTAWQSGERLQVESLIQSEGELLTDDEVLELIYAEIMLRSERGDVCAVDEYLRRFPQFTESLQRLFAIHQALEANTRSLPEQSTPAAPGASTAADMRKIVMIGSRLGPYQLLEKLGHGGMGDVYKARHLKLGRIVALKVLASHLLTRPIALLRFEREMLAVGSLHHPNIVQAFDAGEVDGVHYLSMEYVDGQDLSKILTTTGPMSTIDACESIRQAALGLAAAHRQGLVHRDIKPSNLFIAKQTGQIKILDLGLALLSQEASTGDLTSTGQCFGTADYMAPEQWEDAHTCDARTDLYALGCTLFALLVGRPPFGDGTHRTVPRKMKGHVSEPIPDLVAIRSDVPPDLDKIYRKLMAKQPDERFASADQLAEALIPYANGTQDAVLPTGRVSIPVSGSSPSSPIGQGQAPELTLTGMAAGAIADAQSCNLSRQSNANSVSATQGEAVPSLDGRRTSLRVVAGAAAVALVSVIIMTITSMQGTKSKIDASGDSAVEVTTTPHASRDELIGISSRPDRRPTPLVPKTISWQGWPTGAPLPAIAPFDADQAKQYQAAWAEYLEIPVEFTNSIGMKFSLIPPGEFMMGSTPAEIDEALRWVGDDTLWREILKSEAPPQKVVLSQPIYLGVHEVRQKDYEAVMGSNPAAFSRTGGNQAAVANLDTQSFPVEKVSWKDAADFCTKLSEIEKAKSFYSRVGETVARLDGNGYRLPTEAEWEFACRAGTISTFWIGDTAEELRQAGWFGEPNYNGRTHEVGMLKCNPLGLFDSHGNVWEWVQNPSTSESRQTPQDRVDGNFGAPTSKTTRCWVRGGAWVTHASSCRAASRHPYDATERHFNIGFRAALPIDAAKSGLKTKTLMANRSCQTDRDPSLGGYSLEFDGRQSYVETPIVFDATHPLTIEASVTLDDTQYGPIATDRTGDNGFYLGAWGHEWSQAAYVEGSRLQRSFSSSRPVRFTRTHIAGIYDGNEVRLYVNGRMTGDGPAVCQSFCASNAPFFLGAHTREPGYPAQFRGLFHEVRFSRAAIYVQDFTPPKRFEVEDSTIALYRFSEGSGNTLHDVSKNALHARIHGARWVEGNGRQLPGLLTHTPRLPDGRQWQVDTVAPYYPGGLDWHPDGSKFSCGTGSLVRIHDAKTLAPVRFHTGHQDAVRDTRFSPDGKWLASCSDDSTVRLWNIESGTAGPVLRSHLAGIITVAWAPDSKRLAACGYLGDRRISIWNLDGSLESSWVGWWSSSQLTWSPNGQWIAAQAPEHILRVWTPSGELVSQLQVEGSELWCCSFSPDGKWLATSIKPSGTSESYLALWSTDTWQLAKSWPEQKRVHWPNKLFWSHDSRRLFGVWQSAWALCFDIEQGRWITEAQTQNFGVLAASPDSSKMLVSESERLLKVYDSTTGQIVRQTGFITLQWLHAAVNPKDGSLALANNDLRILSPEGRQQTIRQGLPWSMDSKWSPDGRWLAVVGEDFKVRLWNRDGESGPILEGDREIAGTIAWQPDGQHLLIGSKDGIIRQWHISGEKKLLVELEKGTNVNRLLVAPDGDRFLALSTNNTSKSELRTFDLTGNLKLQFPMTETPDDLAWDPTGQLVAAAFHSANRICIWNATTADTVLDFQQEGLCPARLAWSPSGEWFAVSPSGDPPLNLYVSLWKKDGTSGPTIPSSYGSQACWLDSGRTLVIGGEEWVDYYKFNISDDAQTAPIRLELVRSVRFAAAPPLRSLFDGPGKRLYSWTRGSIQAIDLSTAEPLFSFVPLPQGRSVRIDAAGRPDSREAEIEQELIYYIVEPDGTTSLHTPAEFRKVIGW